MASKHLRGDINLAWPNSVSAPPPTHFFSWFFFFSVLFSLVCRLDTGRADALQVCPALAVSTLSLFLSPCLCAIFFLPRSLDARCRAMACALISWHTVTRSWCACARRRSQ